MLEEYLNHYIKFRIADTERMLEIFSDPLFLAKLRGELDAMYEMQRQIRIGAEL